MIWLDLLFFLPLAVLSNTAFPLAFDPVLIYFASRHTMSAACAMAVSGSLCAGLAGVADAKLLGHFRGRVSGQWLAWLPDWRGRWFYVLTFLFALLPLPFSVVRLAVLRQQPSPTLYGLAVILGRLPRYLLTVFFWRSLALPAWSNLVLLLAAAFTVYRLIKRPEKVTSTDARH